MAGFFSNKTQGQKSRVINVGTEQFHAAAVALIDSLHGPQRGNDAILKKILERFYHYFPRYVTSQPFLTLPERMGILLHNSRKSELVECMAYVLRQMTIDELYAHPLKYREVFDGLSEETPKSYLRDPKTKLASSAFNALANALGITITLSFKEPGKELRSRDVYVGDEAEPGKLSLLIQVQHEKYFPAVKHKEDFAFVGQLAINPPKPVEDINEQKETLAEVIHQITRDNKELLQSYDQWRKTILSMVLAGELTREQLMSLYITFLPKESANTLSISTLEQSLRAPVIANIPMEQEEHTKDLLVKALADWISTRKVQPDSLFDQLDNQPKAAAMR